MTGGGNNSAHNSGRRQQSTTCGLTSERSMVPERQVADAKAPRVSRPRMLVFGLKDANGLSGPRRDSIYPVQVRIQQKAMCAS
jgi:hypothetical protein